MKEAAARKIMIRGGGNSSELFAKTDTIVFDKTGTLTSACPQVTQIIPLSDCSREYILKTAACLEEHFPTAWRGPLCAKRWREGLHHEEEHAEVEYIVAHGISSRLHGKRFLWAATIFSLKMNASPHGRAKADHTQSRQRKIQHLSRR